MRKGKINVDSYRPKLVFIDASDYVFIKRDWKLKFIEKIVKRFPSTISVFDPILSSMYSRRTYIRVGTLSEITNELTQFNIKTVFVCDALSKEQAHAKELIKSLLFIDSVHMPINEILAAVHSGAVFTFISKKHDNQSKGFMNPKEVLWKKQLI